MKYNPKDASTVLPAGEYDATLTAVINTDDTGGPLTSKKGEDMEKIVFTVYSDKGERRLTDFIVSSVVAWKYGVLSKALGHKDAFDAGTFDPANHLGENVRLVLEVEDFDGKEQNKIKRVLPKNGGPSTTKSVSVPRPQGKFSNGKPVEMDPAEIPF